MFIHRSFILVLLLFLALLALGAVTKLGAGLSTEQGTVSRPRSPLRNNSPSVATTPVPQLDDNLWQDVNQTALPGNTAENPLAARNYRTLKLNRQMLLTRLNQAPREASTTSTVVLSLPMPDGSLASFRLEESSVLPAPLAAKYPTIKSYRGEAIDSPGALMRCDWSSRGLHATVLFANQWISIHPWTDNEADYYVSYYGNQITPEAADVRCQVDEARHLLSRRQSEAATPEGLSVGPLRRTYRLAIATTVEYTNSPSLGGGSVASTMASINTWVNALNVIYEKELSVRFILAENNDQVIFTAEPDGLTAGDNGKMVDEIRPILESKLGLGKYDLGQVLSPGGGGLAYIGVVCHSANYKGGGVSLIPPTQPIGTGYGLITLAHEIGHQFNARHTFSDTLADACNSSQFPTNTAYESYAGMTIMSYAEACTRIVWFTAPLFHSASFEQIAAYLNSGGASCALTANTGNQAPTIAAGSKYTIPLATPFTLTATASDPDASDLLSLSYSWEELDAGTKPASVNGSAGPLFRPLLPTSSPARTFPSLAYILNNANVPPGERFGLKTAEALPTVARDLNFRCLVRDGHGGANYDSVVITVANAGPFSVTAPNTAVTWNGGATQSVSWSVNNTNNQPINCQNVRISLSLDGGNTFPYVLAASVPNTGLAQVTVPAGLVSTKARIKVAAVNNIFFDISDNDFTLVPGNTCPAVSGLQPAIGAVGSSVVLNGTNFTGVSAVKFANNVNANFSVDSDNLITVTVPAGAVSGLLTLTKAACAAQQTMPFTVIPASAYVSKVDDGTIESSFQVSGVAQVHFVNRLTPISYPATITAITLFIPNTVEVGTDYRLVLGVNPGGGSNIEGLPLQEIPIKTPTKSQFVTFPVPPTTITAGDFVVGFAHIPQAGVFPVGIDTTPPVQNRSYYSVLGGAQYNLVTTRNFAIRAIIAPGALCLPQTCAGNSAPFISANPVAAIAQGSSQTTTIAAVTDAETAPGNLVVTTGPLPSGIGVSDITNVNGIITARITISCGVSVGQVNIPLTVTDGGALTAATTVQFNIIANTPPVLGSYPPLSLPLGTAAALSPNAVPTDNGTVQSLTAFAPGFTGAFSVNPATGVISVSNAGPVGQYTVTVTGTDNCNAAASTQFSLTVTPSGASLEADVSPRPGGNGTVSIADWTQIGRFVTGLDTPAAGSELQRADCAPRATFGDGKITISDWVQAGRYAAGLDAVVPAAGPTTLASVTATYQQELAGTRLVRAGNDPATNAMLRGQVNSLPIRLSAAGNENALGFTVTFDPTRLSFYRATTASGSILNLNIQQVAAGKLGILLALPAGQSFAAGDVELLNLEFIPGGGEEAVTTHIGFSNQVIACEVADSNALPLAAPTFKDADVLISGRAAAQVSAASYRSTSVADTSIISAFGTELALVTQSVASLPLPTNLGGTRVTIKDNLGFEFAAPLFFVAPNQINYLLPAGLTKGLATVTITNAAGVISRGLLNVEPVAPGLFTADASGKGYAAAEVQHIRSDGTITYERVAHFDPATNQFIANPIRVLSDEQTFLILYGTGLRFRSDLAAVQALIGGVKADVFYVGPQGTFAGLDQINLRLPPLSPGRGDITIELEIDGHLTNPVKISVQ